MVLCLVSMLGLGPHAPTALAQNEAMQQGLNDSLDTLDTALPAYEPSVFEPFNEKMFSSTSGWTNISSDRLPVPMPGLCRSRRGSACAVFFDNIGVVPRFANSLFQLKLDGAAREAGRFMINTTIGGLGFFDVAKKSVWARKERRRFWSNAREVWRGTGAISGAALIGPSTVRDAVGRVADGAMDPKTYFLSTVEVTATDTGALLTSAVNERSLNLELFESVDRFSLDMYSAVQDFYLQNRERQIAE